MLRHSLPLLIVIDSSLAGFAQTSYPLEYREYEVSLFAGNSFSSKFQLPTPVHGGDQEVSRTVGLQYAAGPQLGVRVTQNVNDFWSVNLEYSFANQDLRFEHFAEHSKSFFDPVHSPFFVQRIIHAIASYKTVSPIC